MPNAALLSAAKKHREWLTDALAYRALVQAEGGSISDEEFDNIAQFAKRLYSILGQRTDFITTRAGQNIGTGSKVLSFHGKEGTIYNGAVWTSEGIKTTANDQYVLFSDYTSVQEFSSFFLWCGDGENQPTYGPRPLEFRSSAGTPIVWVNGEANAVNRTFYSPEGYGDFNGLLVGWGWVEDPPYFRPMLASSFGSDPSVDRSMYMDSTTTNVGTLSTPGAKTYTEITQIRIAGTAFHGIVPFIMVTPVNIYPPGSRTIGDQLLAAYQSTIGKDLLYYPGLPS